MAIYLPRQILLQANPFILVNMFRHYFPAIYLTLSFPLLGVDVLCRKQQLCH